jgi:hypothetical protein
MKNPRLVIEVSQRFHCDIKKRALLEGTTMKSYILNVLINHLRRENESNSVQCGDTVKLPPRNIHSA